MLFHNEDCTNFFGHHDCTGGRGEAAMTRYLEVIAGTGVTALVVNTNAERVNYASQAWEPFWQGFDPAGPLSQPFLASVAAPDDTATLGRWRNMVANMLALHQQGIDYPAWMMAGARRHGLSPWISLRMNDVHCQDIPGHVLHSDFWRQHHELRRKGHTGYFSRALDLGQPAVRAHYQRLITETLERFDLDGLELDFLREPFLFSQGEVAAGAASLTAWLGEIRQQVAQAARRLGHPVKLSVRVPSRPAVAASFGLDPVGWAKRGWVDVVVVSPRWASVEYALPLAEWRGLLAGTGVTLLGGLEVMLGAYPGAPMHRVSPKEALGAAAQVWHGGADGLYVFNHFQDDLPGPQWGSISDYQATLRAMGRPAELARRARTHVLTYADLIGPEGSVAPVNPLPATGAALALSLPTGPQPPANWQVTVELHLNPTATPPWLAVNGQAPLAPPRGEPSGDQQILHYPLPAGALSDQPAQFTLTSADGTALRLSYLACHLQPPTVA